MFKSFRWQIAGWFVGLSTLVYLSLTVLGVLWTYASLTQALDEELKVLASEFGHAVDLHESKPQFRDWLRVVQTEPARSLATIQLFDQTGRLLEQYGPAGVSYLSNGRIEESAHGQTMRLRISKLSHKGHAVGYLQIQLPTSQRDTTVRQMVLSMTLVAPLILVGLGFCSYIVSGKAVRPIENTVQQLRCFVADAGHELCTPLTIAQTRAESLERRLEKLEMPDEDVRIILASTERMTVLVNDLLLLAELDAPSAIGIRETISLDKLVLEVVEDFRRRFQEKGIELTCANLEAVKVLGNSDALKILLGNLLENALRYSDSGGRASASTKADAKMVYLQVVDQGMGIAQEHLPFIYDRFYRVDKSRSRASGGSGLGLSIVKAIAESHGGSVSVESEAGKGSCFSVSLPRPDK